MSSDHVFTCSGFRNWKHVRGKGGSLIYHDSQFIKHKYVVLTWNQYCQSVDNHDTTISAQLDNERIKVTTENRKYLKRLRNVSYTVPNKELELEVIVRTWMTCQ